MTGTIDLVITNDQLCFQKLVIKLNEILSFYRLPSYKPYYKFYENIKQNKLLFYNLNESLGSMCLLFVEEKYICYKLLQLN